MKNGAVTIQKISQIGIPVHDLEKAIHFYREQLGLPFLFQTTNMAFFECQGTRLLLSIPEQPQFDHPSSVIYFQVDHIETAYQALTAKGVPFVSEPHLVAKTERIETWIAFFTDPDHNTHALMSDIHPQ